MKVSPDDRLLAINAQFDTVRLQDLASNLTRLTTDHNGFYNAITFPPNGELLAHAASTSTIRLWNTLSGAIKLRLRGLSGWIKSVAFSEDGRLLAAASSEDTVMVWDITTEIAVHAFHQCPTSNLTFSRENIHSRGRFAALPISIQNKAADTETSMLYCKTPILVDGNQVIAGNKTVLWLPRCEGTHRQDLPCYKQCASKVR
jgi:WD40 repeat protein